MISTSEFIDTFLAEAELAASTKVSYGYALNRVASWLDANGLTFDGLSLAVYKRFLHSGDWSNNSQRMYGAALRAFFKWLGMPDHAIFSEPLPRDDSAPGRVLEIDALRDLLASFDTTTPLGWRNLAMLALLAETGLRASELCRLELARVDMRQRKFVVQVKGKRKGEKRWREGIFSEDVARFIEVWLSERPKIAKKESKSLFVSVGGTRPGTQMTRGGLRALFREYGARANIGKLSPHDMRRTMAVLLIEQGAPTRLVQVLGGWDDIKMVERYTRTLRPSQIDRYSPVRSIGLVQQVEETQVPPRAA